jgi:hypothetical protein
MEGFLLGAASIAVLVGLRAMVEAVRARRGGQRGGGLVLRLADTPIGTGPRGESSR